MSTDVPPVAGDTEEILATCTAADAKPKAEVSWSLGALNDSVKVQNKITVDSEGRYTVKSSLIGVASKDLNEQKVQCLVTHPGLKESLELKYTLIIHCKFLIFKQKRMNIVTQRSTVLFLFISHY